MSIRCKSLNIQYKKKIKGKTIDKVCLKDVNLELNPGEVVLLYGSPGSGKTSLFNTISGLIPPPNREAQISWFDYRVKDLNHANKQRYRYISMIYSHFFFLSSLKIRENIILPAVFSGKSKQEIEQRLHLLYEIFSSDDDDMDLKTIVEDEEAGSVDKLSNGQKELIAVARALIIQAPYLFADELFRSMPDEAEARLWNQLMMSRELGIGKKTGFFFITHKEHTKKYNEIDRIYSIDKTTKQLVG